MARISTYNIDQDVRADDKFIGTDSNGIITKNFTPSGIANFLNTTGAIAIAGQNNFFFQTDLAGGRKAGTISFTNGDGEDTPFSNLTTIKISKYASSTTMVLDYLQTLVGQAVFIGQTDNLNNFGIYKLLSLDQDLLEPTFYNATFQLITSHGALLSEKYYALAVYPSTQELVPTSRTLTINGTTYDLSADRTWSVGTVTSVDLSMPPAFTVSNNPITGAGTIAVVGAGTASQYIRGDGQLATFPSGGGGGSSVNYYLNGSVPSGVAGYQQVDNDAVIGPGTDFTLVGNGLIAQFLTDVGNPNRIEIPGGAWNCEIWFSMSSSGGAAKFYIDLLKYDGSTFTLISTGATNPEAITGGTLTDLYLTSLAVPTTTLLATDRLAIRIYIVDNSGGRTATLHTEDNNLCEILTTFSGGVTSLNGLTANTQYFAVGASGTDFNILSTTDTHTFNIPNAGVGISRGLITNVVQSITGAKTFINDLRVNTLTIGKGNGNQAGNVAVGFQAILTNTTGNFNTAVGYQPLYFNTTGGSNVAIGALALNKNTTGTANVATGANALYNNTTGSTNTANGDAALYNNTTGIQNVAIGRAALFSSLEANNNVAVGHNALQFSTATLAPNNAVGAEALKNNTAGYGNTAMGYQTLFTNTTGWLNTAMGYLALYSNTTGNNNVALGSTSLYGNTTGSSNTAIGNASLRGNTTGIQNVAIGYQTMYQANTGNNNIAIGYTALTNNSSGSQNVALGHTALIFNTTGSNNTAVGYRASWSNTTASGNTAIGFESLYSNTTGSNNTANGFESLYSNTIGINNSAIGPYSLRSNTTGGSNIAIGVSSLYANTTGGANHAIGQTSLFRNTTGNFNVANGWQTLYNNTTGESNTAIGHEALSNNINGSYNIGVGFNAKTLNTNDTNSIVIGYNAIGAGSNTVTLGNTSITTTRLRGAVQGGSFVKDGGTSSQYLMADGSIITNGPLFSSSSIIYPIVSGSTQFYSSAIPSNIFSNGNAIRIYTITTTTTTSVANVQTEYYVNSSPSMTGAVRLANYSGTLGNKYYPMDRTLWINGGNFNGRNDDNSSSTSQGASNSAPSSNAIPATQFYIIVQITTTSTDLATLSSLTIEKL